MKVRVIIGANYGDEGKGTVTANYASKAKGKCLNVLTNGGAQRGHTVCTPFTEHTFKHFGSGTFFGADTYYDFYFICNPMQFVMEYEQLKSKYDMTKINIFRNSLCSWTTPWDMMANQIEEISRKDKRHGSCGMGIWATVRRVTSERINTLSYYPTIDDFVKMSFENKISYLKNVRTFHNYAENLSAFTLYKDAWFSDETILHFISDVMFFYEHTKVLDDLNSVDYNEIIFENGQGLLLNSDIDNIHTTPSKTDSTCAVYAINKLKNVESIDLHYITRSYLTRHGNGLMEDERKRKEISSGIKEDRTNHHNEWQGEFRYGALCLPELQKRINSDITYCKFRLDNEELSNLVNCNLEVTHLDEFDCIEQIKGSFNFWNINTYDSPIIRSSL